MRRSRSARAAWSSDSFRGLRLRRAHRGARAPAAGRPPGRPPRPGSATRWETAAHFENIIQPKDLTPVRIFGPRRLTMHAGNRCLKGERSRSATERLLD